VVASCPTPERASTLGHRLATNGTTPAAGIADGMLGSGWLEEGNVSKLVFTILSAVAEAERDRTRERITEVKRDQKGRGRYLGGSVPFGFEIGAGGALVAVPEQQAALGLMRWLRGEGMSLRAIAERVTAAGHPISHMGVKAALAETAQREAA
jgi:putative DNA-invertase from lambdoid prophage Rac